MSERINKYSKLYIVVREEVPDHMVPVVVAHAVLKAHERWRFTDEAYDLWYSGSFRKCVVSVNAAVWNRILKYSDDVVSLSHENKTLNGEPCCAVFVPVRPSEDVPNVCKFAKLWSPSTKQDVERLSDPEFYYANCW